MKFIVIVPVSGGWEYLKDRDENGAEIAHVFDSIEEAEKVGESFGVFEVLEYAENEE